MTALLQALRAEAPLKTSSISMTPLTFQASGLLKAVASENAIRRLPRHGSCQFVSGWSKDEAPRKVA